MQPPEIQTLCRVIVPGAGAIEIQPLGAGLMTETYRVTRDQAAYALKVAAADRFSIGAEPAWEARVVGCAGAAGLAPRMIHAAADGTVMLSDWAAGAPWSEPAARMPDNIRRIASLLRKVHALDISGVRRVLGPAQWIEIYGAALTQRGQARPDPELQAVAVLSAGEYGRLARPAGVLCHSDLHVLNLVQQGESLLLLDWEYAHIADPLWDLAGWSANNDFHAKLQQQLLGEYLHRVPASSEWRRFRLLLWLYDYVCLLWSRVYLAVRRENSKSIAERARLLDGRLRVPANYAA
jgi:thiamine kinase-like enzyme